jgi:hypothetical protein
MRTALWSLLAVLSVTLAGCTLPAAASPTPFTFPTPNLTLTVIFSPTATETPVAPTLPPLLPSPTPESSPSPVAPLPAVTPTASPIPPSGARQGGPVVAAARLTTPPTIDGNVAEWTTPSYLIDRCTFGCGSWSGIDDAYAIYYLGWDAEALYVAVKTSDDRHVQSSTGSRLYRGDSVEIQFDANLAADFRQTSLSGDDFQIGFSPGDFASRTPEVYRWHPTGIAGPSSQMLVRAQETDDGYMLEARVPWSQLGVSPATGVMYGFAISISDNDAAGTAQQQSLVSNAPARELFDPTTWGTMILQ